MCAQRNTTSTSQPPYRDRERDRSLESYPTFGSLSGSQSRNIITSVKRDLSTSKGSTPTFSNRAGSIDGKYREAFRTYDTIKQAFSKTESMNEQFQSFLNIVREKLGVTQGPFDTVKDTIIGRIEELLRFYREVGKGMLETKDKDFEELKRKNEEYKMRIESMEQAFDDSKELLMNNKYVFKKTSLTSLLQGMKLKDEEMAHVERMHIDYKEKKVIIEYNLDEKSMREPGKNDLRENQVVTGVVENKARALWKMSTRMARQFVKINYFLVYNITDMYRILKDKNSKSPSLSKIYSELEGKEKELEKLKDYYKQKEDIMPREALTKELIEKTNPFLVEFLSWFDRNFALLKDIYQNLSKETVAAISEGKLHQQMKAKE